MNRYFVYKYDGTLIAAQETLKGALRYLEPGLLLHEGTPETAVKYQQTLREWQQLTK